VNLFYVDNKEIIGFIWLFGACCFQKYERCSDVFGYLSIGETRILFFNISVSQEYDADCNNKQITPRSMVVDRVKIGRRLRFI
jgi:hypothetical protein